MKKVEIQRNDIRSYFAQFQVVFEETLLELDASL